MQETVRILVVEDDEKIASFVVKGLKQSGYAVDHSADGERGLALALTVAYDAAVVDLMLPKLDGLSLIQQLRAGNIRTPVLILSARASVDDRVRGLQAGGDDYLTKPFAFSELLARVQALIRRATQTTEPSRLTVDGLVLDLITREVRRGSEKIELQPREFADRHIVGNPYPFQRQAIDPGVFSQIEVTPSRQITCIHDNRAPPDEGRKFVRSK